MNIFRSLMLPTCSICLRVLDGETWIDPETIIRERRSFERHSPPRLRPALCPACETSIRRRRVQPSDAAVAQTTATTVSARVGNRSSRRPAQLNAPQQRELNTPMPTIYPLGFAIGVAVALVGLVSDPLAISSIGIVIATVFGALWARDATTELRDRAERVEPETGKLRRRQELRTPGAPIGVHGVDVGGPDVEEALLSGLIPRSSPE
jgi:hypothetical protein